jgi:tetratricopeptide (TPR) repeat protein
MAEPATDAQPLMGQKVAFAGKLASLSLAEAKELLRACGAEWVPHVTPQTSVVVVGQDGLPLRKDGRLSRNLQAARRLQLTQALTILNESDWLASLASNPPLDAAKGLSTAQLSQMVKVPGRQIRTWVRLGLIQPTASILGLHFFDFRQATWARTLCRLAKAGVRPERIRRSLELLRRWLPEVDQSLAQLAVLENDGRLLVRLQDGQLADATGQGCLDFAEENRCATLSVKADPRSAEAWFEEGCELEEAGRLTEASHAYRQALCAGGPDARACFNLGNVLFALGHKEQALERYYQAVEQDPELAGAWLNLGNVLAECGKQTEAMAAYRKVLAVEPLNADAHFNLADVLDQVGLMEEAKAHWRIYMRQDGSSSWGRYARQRAALGDCTKG